MSTTGDAKVVPKSVRESAPVVGMLARIEEDASGMLKEIIREDVVGRPRMFPAIMPAVASVPAAMEMITFACPLDRPLAVGKLPAAAALPRMLVSDVQEKPKVLVGAMDSLPENPSAIMGEDGVQTSRVTEIAPDLGELVPTTELTPTGISEVIAPVKELRESIKIEIPIRLARVFTAWECAVFAIKAEVDNHRENMVVVFPSRDEGERLPAE